jgi:hypothetical protein
MPSLRYWATMPLKSDLIASFCDSERGSYFYRQQACTVGHYTHLVTTQLSYETENTLAVKLSFGSFSVPWPLQTGHGLTSTTSRCRNSSTAAANV